MCLNTSIMLYRQFLFLLLILGNSFNGFSQILEGKVINSKMEPIPFVNVYLVKNTEKGTITNGDGDFVLSHLSPSEDSVCFSAIGYKNRVIAIANIIKNKPILLEDALYTIEGVTIYNPINILNKVSANFGINYPTKTSIIPIHLKEFSTVNNKWLRFEEYQGVLSVDKYISKNSDVSNSDFRLKIDKYRIADDKKYSNDSIDNYFSISGSLEVTLSRLHINQKWGMITNNKNYTYSVEGIDYSGEPRGVLKIFYKRIFEQDDIECTESGHIYINLIDYAVIAVSKERLFKNYDVKFSFNINGKNIRSHYTVLKSSETIRFSKNISTNRYELDYTYGDDELLFKDNILDKSIYKKFKISKVLYNLKDSDRKNIKLRKSECVDVKKPLKYQFNNRDNEIWNSFDGILLTEKEQKLFNN